MQPNIRTGTLVRQLGWLWQRRRQTIPCHVAIVSHLQIAFCQLPTGSTNSCLTWPLSLTMQGLAPVQDSSCHSAVRLSTVISFQWSLFLAFSLHFSSPSAFLRCLFTQSSHLSCGLPRFLQPSCFFVSDLFGNLSSFILTMCPAHSIRLLTILPTLQRLIKAIGMIVTLTQHPQTQSRQYVLSLSVAKR